MSVFDVTQKQLGRALSGDHRDVYAEATVLRCQRDQLLRAAKAALNYASMDDFLDDSGTKANHIFGIRKEHLKALRAAIRAVETPKQEAAD